MKILVACEESQTVCIEFRKKGHEAYSCDVIDCSGGFPEWHIKHDVIPLLNGNCNFLTVDGSKHHIVGKWDMIVAFPPCTFLSNVSAPYFSLKYKEPAYVINRWKCRAEAVAFFFMIWAADCDKIAIENPVGFINHILPPDQIIHPYMFATNINDNDYRKKRTCFWLKNLPVLERCNSFPPPEYEKYISNKGKIIYKTWVYGMFGNSKERSKTAYGVARAMADQWS